MNSKSVLYLFFVILLVIAIIIKHKGANKRAEIIKAISTYASPHKLFGFLNITNTIVNINQVKLINSTG